MSEQAERLKVLSAGIFSLILMLGIARFAYTPLLPLMQQQAGLGLSAGGWLAAVNYMGYLSGALIASLICDLELKDRLYRIGLVVAALTTVGMAVTEQVWLWALFRFFAGLQVGCFNLFNLEGELVDAPSRTLLILHQSAQFPTNLTQPANFGSQSSSLAIQVGITIQKALVLAHFEKT